ncbi:MAG: glucose-6-phosphate isomerase, partial [Kangiellaceae bacterium]|nr:glucose-6-phosphate isomerase [Kangiellaceae bacterium]
SASKAKMDNWGISPKNQLLLWDWVGGRFSLWSTVGLSIAIKLGMNNFKALLKGANSLDKHFVDCEFDSNLPVLLGLVGIWNINFRKISAQAVLPYDARLKFFPDYLTQLEMESNGKSVSSLGQQVKYRTCPVLWGEVGPNAQHAFYQLLHQGTQKINCDFIVPIKRYKDHPSKQSKSLREQHMLTLANCFAQSRALMIGNEGKLQEENDIKGINVLTHQIYPGDQPSTTILVDELTPYSLGQLIALYEHKVFVMASLWDINPFDQWGVELGKSIAKDTFSSLEEAAKCTKFDESTNNLINFVKKKGAYNCG